MALKEWALAERDLKRYPHFDPPLDQEAAESLAKDPERVRQHAFYPFMRYEDRWTRFAPKGNTGVSKSRPIRYAARADAYIYSRYRHLLAERYESELAKLNLSNSILAYRRIACGDGVGGKCNIHFARDAIGEIRRLGNCCCVTLDISTFFETLDHARLKALWARMLGVAKLPADHHAVFQAITRYSFVEKVAVYERLGHYGVKRHSSGGQPIKGYLTHYKHLPVQLCAGSDFRLKIAGANGQKSLIQTN